MAASTSPSKQAGNGALLLLCMAQFMLILDISIVNVALPSIQRDLHFVPENLQLVVTSYALTFGGLLLLGGRVADLLGRRRIFIAGILLFTLASLTCGLAQSDVLLVVARAVQGIGGAFVSPAALSLLTTIFAEGEARNRALGVWSAVAAAGGAAGLLLGGIVTDIASWRWVFFLNVPLGLLVAAASSSILPRQAAPETGQLDIAGAITITASLVALVYGLNRGFSDRLGLALLVIALLCLISFIIIERRSAEPLVDFSLFRSRMLTGSNIATLFLSAVVVGQGYFLTLYFQQVLGYSPLTTAFAFLPQTFVAGFAAVIGTRVVSRVGIRRTFLIGMVAMVIGAALLSQLAPSGSYWTSVFPGLLLISIGLGIGFSVGTLAATAGVAATQQGVASGVFNTSQQIGGAVGLALLATIAATAPAAETPQKTLTNGFDSAFLVAAGFAIVAALAVAIFMRQPVVNAEVHA